MKKEKRTTENFLSSLLGERTVEKSAGIAFSLATVLPTLLVVLLLLFGSPFGLFEKGYEEQDWYRYCNFLLPQIAYALVAVAFFSLSKLPVREFTGKLSWKYFLLALVLQFGVFSLGELNGLFLEFLGRFGYTNKPIELPSLDGFGLVGVLLTVALLPAVFEEILFRGIVLKGTTPFGKLGAVLLCGGLFSLFHQNPAQTVYQFCCGAAYALLALRSGSVLPTMLAHFCNNAVIVLLEKFPVISPLPLSIGLICVSALCLLGAIAYLIFFDKKVQAQKEKGKGLQFLLCASVGILVCLVAWFTRLFGGM